jgi:hypothetical protein
MEGEPFRDCKTLCFSCKHESGLGRLPLVPEVGASSSSSVAAGAAAVFVLEEWLVDDSDVDCRRRRNMWSHSTVQAVLFSLYSGLSYLKAYLVLCLLLTIPYYMIILFTTHSTKRETEHCDSSMYK